jgi:hypothetical protein
MTELKCPKCGSKCKLDDDDAGSYRCLKCEISTCQLAEAWQERAEKAEAKITKIVEAMKDPNMNAEEKNIITAGLKCYKHGNDDGFEAGREAGRREVLDRLTEEAIAKTAENLCEDCKDRFEKCWFCKKTICAIIALAGGKEMEK